MSKRSNRKHKPKAHGADSRRVPNQTRESAESKTAVAATVAWMLSLMSTITAEVVGLICRYYTVLVQPSDLMTVLSSVMLFVALISGLATLGLIPVVLRVAQSRPPRSILQIAIVAGGLPIAVVVLQFIRRF